MNNALLLECLFELGVDNWEGYEQAIALYHQREDEINNYGADEFWPDVELRD